MIYPLKVSNRVITHPMRDDVIQNGIGSDSIKVSLDAEWQKLRQCRAVFVNGDASVGVLFTAAASVTIAIPWEVLREPGHLYVTLVGFPASGKRIVTRMMERPFKVACSGKIDGSEESEPELDEISKMLELVTKALADTQKAGTEANAAATKANSAATKAESASKAATDAAGDATASKTAADAAAKKANDAATAATASKTAADGAASAATTAAGKANAAATSANSAAASANGAAEDATAAANNAMNIANSIAGITKPGSDEVEELRESNSILATDLAELKDGYIVIGETAYMPSNRKSALSGESITISNATVSGETATLS